MATDNLMPQSSTSVIKHFMLRSSTTGQGLTGKAHSDFSGKYNIAGGAEVTLSFSSGSAGDAYSSGKIVPLGLGKYAWHVPDAVFASLGNVSVVLSVSGGIDVHCEWLVVAAVRDTAAFGANITTPPTAAAVADEVQTRTIARVTLVDTCSVNSDMRGTNDAMLAASYVSPPSAATISTQVAADLLAAHGSGSWTTATGFATPTNVSDAQTAILAKLPAALEGGRIAAALDSATIDAIWDEVLTGATHNVASSAGRRLRQLADTVVLVDGVCDAASNAGTDSTGTITLEVGTTTACVGQAIRCENQVRYIASYDAGTRVAQLDRPWCVVPDAGDEYVIFNVRNPLVGLASVALAGSTAAAVNEIVVDTGTTLPAQIAGIEGGGGLTGPYTRTITVTDADTDEPIEGAKVRLYRTGETGTVATDDGGVASFTVEAATWLYAIAASGYTGVSGSVVVSANGNTDVQMDAVSITPPSNPSLSAIVVLCLDSAGQPEADVDVDIRIVTVPSGSTNIAYKGSKQTATSDADGIARFEVVQGSVCEWKRGRADVWSRVTIDSDSVTNVTSVIGSP